MLEYFQCQYFFLTPPHQGIISADGQRWLEHRRFALKHLKDFGFGKVGLEGVIQEEAEEIVAILSEARQRRRLKPSCQVFKS